MQPMWPQSACVLARADRLCSRAGWAAWLPRAAPRWTGGFLWCLWMVAWASAVRGGAGHSGRADDQLYVLLRRSSTVEVATSPPAVHLWPELAFQLHQAPDPGAVGWGGTARPWRPARGRGRGRRRANSAHFSSDAAMARSRSARAKSPSAADQRTTFEIESAILLARPGLIGPSVHAGYTPDRVAGEYDGYERSPGVLATRGQRPDEAPSRRTVGGGAESDLPPTRLRVLLKLENQRTPGYFSARRSVSIR
jgi:hypothetical protein